MISTGRSAGCSNPGKKRGSGELAVAKTVREWMGVEPTAARSVRPATDFEDRGAHRGPTTPSHPKHTAIGPFRQVAFVSYRDLHFSKDPCLFLVHSPGESAMRKAPGLRSCSNYTEGVRGNLQVPPAGCRGSVPAVRSNIRPAGCRGSVPAVRSNTRPAGCRGSAPAVRSNTRPAGCRGSAPAVRSNTRPAGRRGSAPAVRSNIRPAGRRSSAPARPSGVPIGREMIYEF